MSSPCSFCSREGGGAEGELSRAEAQPGKEERGAVGGLVDEETFVFRDKKNLSSYRRTVCVSAFPLVWRKENCCFIDDEICCFIEDEICCFMKKSAVSLVMKSGKVFTSDTQHAAKTSKRVYCRWQRARSTRERQTPQTSKIPRASSRVRTAHLERNLQVHTGATSSARSNPKRKKVPDRQHTVPSASPQQQQTSTRTQIRTKIRHTAVLRS